MGRKPSATSLECRSGQWLLPYNRAEWTDAESSSFARVFFRIFTAWSLRSITSSTQARSLLLLVVFVLDETKTCPKMKRRTEATSSFAKLAKIGQATSMNALGLEILVERLFPVSKLDRYPEGHWGLGTGLTIENHDFHRPKAEPIPIPKRYILNRLNYVLTLDETHDYHRPRPTISIDPRPKPISLEPIELCIVP